MINKTIEYQIAQEKQNLLYFLVGKYRNVLPESVMKDFYDLIKEEKSKQKQLVRTYLQYFGSEIEFTEEQKNIINEFKSIFNLFFEGFELGGIQPIYNMKIRNLQITNFKYNFEDSNFLNVTIVLNRPCLLIGKGGETIDSLNAYLKQHDIKIDKIEESQLWKTFK